MCTLVEWLFLLQQSHSRSVSIMLLIVMCGYNHSNPCVYSQMKLDVTDTIFENVLAAFGRAIKWPELTKVCRTKRFISEMLSQLCFQAERDYYDYGGSHFWQRVCNEIHASVHDLAAVKQCLELAFDDLDGNRNMQGELSLLRGLSRGCIHVGMIVSHLLLPTPVDPVSLSEIHYQCYQMLVSFVYHIFGLEL